MRDKHGHLPMRRRRRHYITSGTPHSHPRSKRDLWGLRLGMLFAHERGPVSAAHRIGGLNTTFHHLPSTDDRFNILGVQ